MGTVTVQAATLANIQELETILQPIPPGMNTSGLVHEVYVDLHLSFLPWPWLFFILFSPPSLRQTTDRLLTTATVTEVAATATPTAILMELLEDTVVHPTVMVEAHTAVTSEVLVIRWLTLEPDSRRSIGVSHGWFQIPYNTKRSQISPLCQNSKNHSIKKIPLLLPAPSVKLTLFANSRK